MVIRRISPLAAAKTFGLVYAAIGVIIGAFITLIGFTGAYNTSGMPLGGALGLAAIIILPIFYGMIGFLSILLVTSLYNWSAGLVGGIEIETDSGDRLP